MSDEPAAAATSRTIAQPDESGHTAPTRTRRHRGLPLPVALLAALAAGGALLIAFPPYGQWWAAPAGVGLLAAACHRRRLRGGLLLGLLTGLALFVPLLSWTTIVIGAWPWPMVLAAFEAAYLAALGGAAATTSRLVDAHRWCWPPLTGCLWVAQEALRGRQPWGGLPWGRLAFSQADAPTLGLAALGGAPLVTFAVAATGGLLAAAAWRTWRRPTRPTIARAAGLLAATAALTTVGLAVPTAHPTGPALQVAIVQGNVPRLGLEFNAQRRAVLDNHVNATLALARRVHSGNAPAPDLVVWPENASDIDPLINPDATRRIDAAADAIGAPILLGAVLVGPGDHARNASIVWHPHTGPQRPFYVKRHPVPFAEYIPMRSLARHLTDKVDLVRSDFVAGHRIGALDTGPVTVGDVICFEVGYDALVHDTVTHGAQLLTVQTNNADFNTAEARQQLAMVQLRAVETGRPALMASTVGISAFVDPAGHLHQATGFNTPAVISRAVRPAHDTTPATRLGAIPEIALTAAAVAGLLAAAGLGWRKRRDSRAQSGR